MGRRSKHFKNFTTEQIETLLESNPNYLTGVKLFAMLQIAKGYSSRKLSEFYGTSFKQICNWANRFDVEGIKGLRMKPGRGRHSFLTEKQKNQLRDDLLKPPKDYGYKSVNWTGLVIREHIKQHYNVDYKIISVYKLIRKLGCNFQNKIV
jgi:transposase